MKVIVKGISDKAGKCHNQILRGGENKHGKIFRKMQMSEERLSVEVSFLGVFHTFWEFFTLFGTFQGKIQMAEEIQVIFSASGGSLISFVI